MSDAVLLVGPLAHPKMVAALGLEGESARITGSLVGGARAGIDADGWPALREGDEGLDALRVVPTAGLLRYAAVMGLEVRAHSQGPVLGVQAEPASEGRFEADDWPADLAAEIARLVLEAPPDRPIDAIAARLPAIGVWADSQRRGRASVASGQGIVPQRGAGDVQLLSRREPFAGFFAVEEWDLTHQMHDGGRTPVVRREGFVLGDAVVVLPWDPARDRVLVIEQFRLAPAMRRDPQPWLLEPVAGRVDAGEGVEAAARREAREEADLELHQLLPAIHHYPSPGAVGEFLYLFVGLADLPDGVAGVHGLDGEVEDIRGHVLDRSELTRMTLAGQITNGPLAMLALWLDCEAARIGAKLAGS